MWYTLFSAEMNRKMLELFTADRLSSARHTASGALINGQSLCINNWMVGIIMACRSWTRDWCWWYMCEARCMDTVLHAAGHIFTNNIISLNQWLSLMVLSTVLFRHNAACARRAKLGHRTAFRVGSRWVLDVVSRMCSDLMSVDSSRTTNHDRPLSPTTVNFTLEIFKGQVGSQYHTTHKGQLKLPYSTKLTRNQMHMTRATHGLIGPTVLLVQHCATRSCLFHELYFSAGSAFLPHRHTYCRCFRNDSAASKENHSIERLSKP